MQRVLITGAASGLGRALALAWAKRGARVLIADLNAERGAESLALCRDAGAAHAQFILLDVRKAEDFEAAVAWLQQHWGGLDVMVNNAGVAGGGRFDSISEADWQWMLDINLMGVVRGCRAVTPLFKQQASGSFVNIASMAGLLNPPAMSNYNVAKAGVIALSESLTVELAPWNIRTLVVCPSYFQTNLNESLRTSDDATRAALPKLLASSELSADDIAAGILAALDRGDSLYLPHERARAAWQHKLADIEKFREELYRQARKLAGRQD
jgi:NAD(P)-dependent dehydrogenase (short-subunit alcohol dehydrogenase family)